MIYLIFIIIFFNIRLVSRLDIWK